MHLLVLADTFPNRVEPWRGPYNRRQFECLAKHCRLTVIAPLPWHATLPGRPWHALVSGRDDVLDGIALYHPRHWYVPIIGRRFLWRGILRAAERVLRRLPDERYDLVMTTFGYPHGYAAMRLAARLGVPYVVKVRGSDLHALPAMGRRRELTARALRGAAAVVAVSGNLADIARELGAAPERVHVLTNGVDAGNFPLIPREHARRGLATEDKGRRIVLFIGSLLPVKGLDVLMEAFATLARTRHSDATLVVAGEGPMRRRLERQAARLGISDRVRFLGPLPHDRVCTWINAADVLVLPSRNEGCPNVVLEALSCGTPVVASRVGAVPDLLDEGSGVIVPPGDPSALAHAIARALDTTWDRAAIRQRVEGMSWESNAQRLYEILSEAVASNRSPRHNVAAGGAP